MGHDSRRDRPSASQQAPKRTATVRRTVEGKLVVDRAFGGGFEKRGFAYEASDLSRLDVFVHRMRGGALHAPSFGEHMVRARVPGLEPGDPRLDGRIAFGPT